MVRDGIAGGPWPCIQKKKSGEKRFKKSKKKKTKIVFGCLVKVTGMVVIVFYVKCELTIGNIIHHISLCSKGFWRNSIEHCEEICVCLCPGVAR